jgi:membrane-bound ClpP family serine protease
VHGELWRARAVGDEPIAEGAPVRVERLADGLVLEVVPGEASEPLPEDAPGKVPA